MKMATKQKIANLFGKLPRCWYYLAANAQGYYNVVLYIWLFKRKWELLKF